MHACMYASVYNIYIYIYIYTHTHTHTYIFIGPTRGAGSQQQDPYGSTDQ